MASQPACYLCGTTRPTCVCGCDHTRTLGYETVCKACCGHNRCKKCNKCTPTVNLRLYGTELLHQQGLCECVRCLLCRNRNITPCNCCDTPLRFDRGTTHGQHYRLCAECCLHRCCTVPVAQLARPLVFWTPTAAVAKSAPPFERLNGQVAELVLGKLAGVGKLNKRQFIHNPSRRYASVEIEVAQTRKGLPINTVCEAWSCPVVHDGSINRGTAMEGQGYEINTAPACGDALYAQLRDITEALAATNSQVNRTCGLHVHVDARDFGYHDIWRLLEVYCRLEPALFAGVPADRALNRYCRTCANVYLLEMNKMEGKPLRLKEIKQVIVQATYGNTAFAPYRAKDPLYYQFRNNHRGAGEGTGRYYALNLHSWFLRGTIENRLHHGTLDFDEIYGWARLNIELLDRVAELSAAEVHKIAEPSTGGEVRAARDWVNRDSTIALLDSLVVAHRFFSEESFNHLLQKINRMGE